MVIGVLALQGDVREHLRALEAIGVEGRPVKRSEHLDGLDGLIIPGGESTTITRLLRRYELFEELERRGKDGFPLFGTCAGMIVMARDIVNSDQPRLGLLDVAVERNAYGRQLQSFEADLDVKPLEGPGLRGVFIRAPGIERVGCDVEVLATWEGRPVLVRQGNLLAASFHPELTGDSRLHRFFVEAVAAAVGEEARK